MELIRTMKKLVQAVLLILFISGMQNAFAQDQVNMAKYLTEHFRRYCEQVPREEVFVSTDREEYIAGEELWFNAWLIDRKSSRPSTESKIVYFELLNPENKPVVQKRIRLDNGSGPGNIELPDSLSSGSYTIRAYTNWMKNFLPDNCFIKEINIYNAYKSGSFKSKIYKANELKSRTKSDSLLNGTNSSLGLKVNNQMPDSLEFFLTIDKKPGTDKDNIFYLFIQTHGNINHVGTFKINDEQTKIALPKSKLTTGINQITVFDFMGRPVAEKYIYTPDKNKQVLSIHSADSAMTRSKVTLEIDMGNLKPEDLNRTNFSISVAPIPNKNQGLELDEYMIFGSEFGILPGRTIHGKKMGELPSELIDSLLQNIKSNWIDWPNIISDTIPDFKFKTENEDHYLSGVLSTGSQKPASPGEFVLLSIPGKTPAFQYAITNNEARFSFSIPINDGEQDLIIQPDDIWKDFKVNLESSFSDINLPSEMRSNPIVKPIPQYISEMSINYQVSEIYESSSVGTTFYDHSQSPIHSKRFYGKPSSEIILKDWVKLPVMEEVFFEIVPNIKLKKKGPDYEMLMVDPVGKILYDAPPTMLIDGVIIRNPKIIANLNPGQVEKIDVVKNQYRVGDYLFNGLVNVITKSGDFKDIPVPNQTIRMQYRIFDPVPIFNTPDYSSAEMKISRTPDFRNTLYWNPSVKPQKDGKIKIEFWTSDDKSDYEINIQGITAEGKTLSIKKNLKIR